MLEQFISSFGQFLAGGVAQTLYWCAAAAGSVFFLAILFFSSSELPADSADISGDGVPEHIDTGFDDFQFLSLRSILAFITMFGWTGVIWGKNGWIGFIAAFLIGLLAMFLTALAIWLMYKLQHSGNIAPGDFIGKTGTVYLSIPAKRSGSGKVTVRIAGSTAEISAEAEEELPTGTPVVIESQISESLYLVRKS